MKCHFCWMDIYPEEPAHDDAGRAYHSDCLESLREEESAPPEPYEPDGATYVPGFGSIVL